MDDLTQTVFDKVTGDLATAVGISTADTLEGGPPSVDLSYVLPNAKSAVCFVVPLDQSFIIPYLKKEDYHSHIRDLARANKMASGIALDLAKFLEQMGYPSYPIAANNVYRHDPERGAKDMVPDISLRYLAVASGVAHFGFSGNVIRKEEGAAFILGGVVTTAELQPTGPLPEEDNYCDGCRMCMASCASEFMDPDNKDKVSIGGHEYSYSGRRLFSRCGFVCGGFTGLHRSGKWSTWSPGRFPIPEQDDGFEQAVEKHVVLCFDRPEPPEAKVNLMMPGKFNNCCGNCQLVCASDKEERKKRHKALISGGCVVPNPDGSVEAYSPEEAARRLAAMDPETRARYEEF